ncbi:gametogenetin-binding protein 2-like [Pomacea canaliculata]|uniref:gametogenetin-binding protein 2-like n=1 Tax=Pomacea canaliculata TaxID=400727 RepID=UPI000D7356FA|nr:gametogenetin-binding protein 2-like [Pomacea canaliculata]
MARLVAVCRANSDYIYERRQVPLEESGGITMVVQFGEKCRDCEGHIKRKEMECFRTKCQLLTKDELAVALLVTRKDLLSQLSQMVTCVGCRHSVERLFLQLVKSGHPAVDPLVITQHSELSIKHELLFDPRALFCLFYIHGPRHSAVIDSILKSKKNKRCNLHSLDTHKAKPTGSWLDIWNFMSEECRNEILIINSSSLEKTLSAYLTKHRFCTECRSKVMLAFNILIGEHDSISEKGYCPVLYDKLRCCPEDGHIHIVSDTEYIASLIEKAEPELTGINRRDRHAKTLDIAQEEVLTCLGINIFERLHRLGQKLRGEEQTWQLLFFLGLETLKRSFECAVERKQGVSNLERMCEELLEEERVKEQRRELKRQKKKLKKAIAKNERENQVQLGDEDPSHCECSSSSIATRPLQTSHLAQCDNHSSHGHCHTLPSTPSIDPNLNCLTVAHHCSRPPRALDNAGLSSCRNCDHGYDSEQDSCENCSVHTLQYASGNVSHDGISVHDEKSFDKGREYKSSSLKEDLHHNSCNYEQASPHRSFGTMTQRSFCRHSHSNPTDGRQIASSLQDMLEESTLQEDQEEEGGISEEDIKFFLANQSVLQRQRLELREDLRRRFNAMQQQRGASPISSPASSPSPSPKSHSKVCHS